LVNSAHKLANEDEYDQVWCVFDRDEGAWTAQNFNNALQNAKTYGFHVAYSNECFEIWYILHFEFLNTGLPRSDYEDKLTLGMCNYLSNKLYLKPSWWAVPTLRNIHLCCSVT
jgi:RloB-like protein